MCCADVTWELREEFCRLSIETRLNECELAVRAMRKGLNAVVPANMLSLFSHYDLELLVCGNPVVCGPLSSSVTSHLSCFSCHVMLCDVL